MEEPLLENAEAPAVESAEQPLSPSSVETLYFTADWAVNVGGHELFCGGAKYSWGTKGPKMVQFKEPCANATSSATSCWQRACDTCAYAQIVCPAYWDY